MGESSACLVRSFSAATSAEPKEGDPHRALTTSISFGRFTSESLAWEKWSWFSNNRYLEEAEKSSKPGSVAEKKAYFEAHYKRIAAKKAAELLDQQNVTSNEFDLLESDNVDHTHYSSLMVSEPSKSDSPTTDLVLSVDAKVRKPNVEENNSETDEVEEAEIATEQLVIEENSIQVESSRWNENVEIRSKIMSSQQEKMATTGSSHQRNLSSSSRKKQLIPFSNPSTYIRASKLHSFLKLSPVQPRKEDSATQPSQKGTSNVVEKPRSTLNSLHMSINISSHACETRKTLTTIHKMGNSKTVRNVAKTSRDSSTTLRTPTRASVNDLSAHPSEIHLPERLRSKTLGVCSGSGRWPAVGKSQSPYVNRLKPADASGHKARPPMLASTFSFRCEERAAKRKEKLEEKLNAEAEKVRLQVKSKDKTDNFLKMRQSTGVMGKPIPNSNHGTESPITHVEKIPLTRPRSPKLGGNPTHSVVKDTVSVLPWRSVADIVGSKHVISKSNRTPFHPTN